MSILVEALEQYKKPRILEKDFLKFLPEFVDNVGKKVEQQSRTAYDRYLSIVKNEYTAVECWSDDQQEMLFVIPPLRYHADMKDKDISGMHKKADAYLRRNPTTYYRMVNDILNETIGQPQIPEEDVKQWQFILGKYGYARKSEASSGEEGTGKANSAGDAAGKPNEDISFESGDDDW